MKKLPEGERDRRRKATSKARYHANKEAEAARKKIYYEKNKAVINSRNKNWHDNNKESVANRKKADKLATPDKYIERSKKYRALNKDKIADQGREYRSRIEVKATIASRAKTYQEKYREKIRAYHRNYAKDNRHKYNQRDAARNAREIQATPQWANKFIMDEIYHLAQLRSRLCRGKWHVDHIVPIVSKIVCGLHCEQNMQVIPARVNIVKGNRYWPSMPTLEVAP